MGKKSLLCTLVLMALASVTASADEGRPLGFEDRVRAQEAIERVYHAHRLGARRSFEETFPRETLERKVRAYLERTDALERIWSSPITAEMLERELARIANGSLLPGRLEELYEALDHDVVLIQECLVRPILVDRLIRGFFDFDDRLHAAQFRQVSVLRQELLRYGIHAFEEDPRRFDVELFDAGDRADAPARVGEIGPVQEMRDAFVIRTTVEESPKSVQIAGFSIRKRPFDGWWAGVRVELDPLSVQPVASRAVELPDPGNLPADRAFRFAGVSCGPDDVWDNGSLDDLLDPRQAHTAVWTGSMMLVWGGVVAGNTDVDSGSRYDPATDTWTRMSAVGAPEARRNHIAVWTGDEMLVWGGQGSGYLDTGGRYDPATNTWTAMSTVEAPAGRIHHSAVWTGNRLVIWGGVGGSYHDTGGRYDPTSDSWSATSTIGAPAARAHHSAIWTGGEMLVWGGSTPVPTDTGGRYDPATDTWTLTEATGAPAPRSSQSAVWTGSSMIVWGGIGGGNRLDTGGLYDPVSDSWLPTATSAVASARSSHSAIWTGSRMLIWGGGTGTGVGINTGALYDPQTDSWAATTTGGAPRGRWFHTAVWTGNTMMVWGGAATVELNTGGRYEPATDSWTPIFSGDGPQARWAHTAVWTGNRMVVWGGMDLDGSFATGGLYDPATDSWTTTPTAGAPSARNGHTALWAGDSLLIWGGRDSVGVLDTGGRYDPSQNDWTPISVTDAPVARSGHTAIWTGDSMVVWGGNAGGMLNTGGRYDPLTDAWVATSTIDAPSPRSDHTAVWTGSTMIAWGGSDGDPLNTGGRYHPATDSWMPTATVGAASPRGGHTAVWTGNSMLVWGGSFWTDFLEFYLGTGSRYDPATDTWVSVSTPGAPAARTAHTAVLAGNQMLIWGGSDGDNSTPLLDTGGRYDLDTNVWAPISMIDAPTGRNLHTAVWADGTMLVWGGYNFNSGGRYALGSVVDADGDGRICSADCNDTDGGAFAVPGEVTGLEFPPDKATLRWDSAVPSSGTGTVHDVLRGSSSELPVGSGLLEICLDPVGTVASIEDGAVPNGGTAYWYVVHGRNACGTGVYGFDSDDHERLSNVCP